MRGPTAARRRGGAATRTAGKVSASLREMLAMKLHHRRPLVMSAHGHQVLSLISTGLAIPVCEVFKLPPEVFVSQILGRGTRERLEETPQQAAARLAKLSGAVKTILECLGEDPAREGLLGTPERYAKAMLFFTKGYQENIGDIVNGAIFHENHKELVIVKDIEVFSLCEHHMVPFTGKVSIYLAFRWNSILTVSFVDAYWIYS